MNEYHLVLIETSGNQGYIFASNKLRENVGASELTHRVGTQFFLGAIAETGPSLWKPSPSETRQALVDKAQNPPIEADSHPFEVILAASGKAMLLVRDAGNGRDIIARVTERILREAPGLEAHGAVGSRFNFSTQPVHNAIREVHHLLETVRSRVPGPSQRFLRIPPVSECQTSGFPAAEYVTRGLPEGEWAPAPASQSRSITHETHGIRGSGICASATESSTHCQTPRRS